MYIFIFKKLTVDNNVQLKTKTWMTYHNTRYQRNALTDTFSTNMVPIKQLRLVLGYWEESGCDKVSENMVTSRHKNSSIISMESQLTDGVQWVISQVDVVAFSYLLCSAVVSWVAWGKLHNWGYLHWGQWSELPPPKKNYRFQGWGTWGVKVATRLFLAHSVNFIILIFVIISHRIFWRCCFALPCPAATAPLCPMLVMPLNEGKW